MVVGLGSNQGAREIHLSQALLYLRNVLVNLRVGPWLETPPWGPVPQAPFLNTVALGYTLRSPWELLFYFQHMERKAGRTKGKRWGPRPLDLDLIFYGTLHVNSPGLILPHPRYLEREFVVSPLRVLLEQLGFRPPGSPEDQEAASGSSTPASRPI